MFKFSLALAAVVSVCSGTSIPFPLQPDLQAIGRVRQAIGGEADLFGSKFTATFKNGQTVACFGGGILVGACSDWFTVSMTRNGRNVNTFEVKNTSGLVLREFQFDALTILDRHRGKDRMFGNLAIDLPGDRGTFGSGVGHALAGLRVKEFTLLNPISEDLFGGVNMKVAIPGGQSFRFRGDLDEMVASPDVGTLASVGTGLCLTGLAWWRRRRQGKAS